MTLDHSPATGTSADLTAAAADSLPSLEPLRTGPRTAVSAEGVPNIKVQYTCRITYAADLQLKALAKEGHTQVDLLAEALNLLFTKHGVDEVA